MSSKIPSRVFETMPITVFTGMAAHTTKLSTLVEYNFVYSPFAIEPIYDSSLVINNDWGLEVVVMGRTPCNPLFF